MAIEHMVVSVESEKGFTVSCPTIAGFRSQSTAVEEAVANM